MRCTRHQNVHDALTDVVADDAESGARKLHGQRQADIAKPDHADNRRAVLNLREQRILHAVVSGGGRLTPKEGAHGARNFFEL